MPERLSLEGLRYVQAVSEAKSFSAAARGYGVTQPALSNGVAKIEEQLGERLFDRSPRGVALTGFGEKIVPFIERALWELDAIVSEARRLTGTPEQDSIRMGLSPLINPVLISRAFAGVCGLDHPYQLVLREAAMTELREGLISGELDVILIPSVEPLPRFEHRIIDSEPVVLVSQHDPDDNTAADGPVELTEAADGPFIVVPNSCGLRKFTEQLFEAQGLPLETYPGAAASYSVLEQWAGLGLGSAILPKSRIMSPDTAHYRALLEDGHEVEIFYEAVWHPRSPIAGVIECLAASLTRT